MSANHPQSFPGIVPVVRIADRYRLEESLAKGGMGAVYRAVDEQTGATVALKRMLMVDDPHACALFEREYRTLQGIQHPRIIGVYDYGVDAQGPFYTMELLQGQDLYALAPLPFAQACRYLRDVATSLALLHTRRLVHRDVTPRNIRITEEGHCKLLDFGALSTFGVPERIVGTPPFIPPEALHGAPLDQRADVFSFGALAYWLLTRKHAYPARAVDDLVDVWQQAPAPPSHVADDIPSEVDELVLRLLKLDPTARPSSMAEVIDLLTAFGGLEPEDEGTTLALAKSYLVQAPLVGRDRLLETLWTDVEHASDRESGVAIWLQGEAGTGRTRLLHELWVRSKLSGVQSVHVDAGMHGQPNGTAIALLHALIDSSPEGLAVAQQEGELLATCDAKLAERIGRSAIAPSAEVSGDWRTRLQEAMRAVVEAACSTQRLSILIDNADEADDASIALLAALALLSAERPLVMVCSVSSSRETDRSLAASALRRHSRLVDLPALDREQTRELLRNLFGDAPNLTRCSQWLHDLTAGRPLLLMEQVRRLFDQGLVRFVNNLWALPVEKPQATVDDGLEDMLAGRFSEMTRQAHALAEALAIQRSSLSREHCLWLAGREGPSPYALLDELVRNDVLREDPQGYSFTHSALRSALLERAQPERLRQLHIRNAEWILSRVQEHDALRTQIEAGWHLLQAGEETRGADLLSAVAYDVVGIRLAFADLQAVAPALEAALEIYVRQGRSIYERMPLMSALAQAGYYEARSWGERYGEQALALLDHVSGLALARRFQRWIGKTPGLLLGLLIGWLRFLLCYRKRRYGFWSVFVQLFGVVTTQTGAASMALDGPRAARMARMLEPFAHLPQRMTPVGIWQFCDALKEIARENQAAAVDTWTRLIGRYNNPRCYPSLPNHARKLYLGGLWFSLGVFEAMRDGNGALRAADELDRIGLKLYQMIASQLRALHYAFRGELSEAQRHRDQVELRAIQVGSAWQAELWEPAAYILIYGSLADLVECRRLADRLTQSARSTPSLALYADLTGLLIRELRSDESALQDLKIIMNRHEPRSYVGWGALHSYAAQHCNDRGNHTEALRMTSAVLEQLTPADLEFSSLFLNLQAQHVIALAGLERFVEARTFMGVLRERYQASTNPLTHGQLHETEARIAVYMQEWQRFNEHLAEARRWYQGTGSPALVARGEKLAMLRTSDPVVASEPMAQLTALAADALSSSHAGALLQRIARDSGAVHCSLFTWQDGRMQQLGSLPELPSDGLTLEVETRLRRWQELSSASDDDMNTTSTTDMAKTAQPEATGYVVLPLKRSDGVVVGALALQSGDAAFHVPTAQVLQAVAAGLARASDPDSVASDAQSISVSDVATSQAPPVRRRA